MAPFAHSLRHHGGDFKNRKRISQTETTKTTHLFLRATSWKRHSSKLQNCLLCLSSLFSVFYFPYLSISYIFILYIYIFIYLFLFIYLLFHAVCHPPSAIRHPPSTSAVRFRVLQTPFQCKVRCSLLFKARLLLAGSA